MVSRDIEMHKECVIEMGKDGLRYVPRWIFMKIINETNLGDTGDLAGARRF